MQPSESAARKPIRAYVFTLHAPEGITGDNAVAWAKRIIEDSIGYACCRFMCGQLEQCPSTGRLHIQGYTELTRPQRISYLKRWGHGIEDEPWCSFQPAHFEPRMGTVEQAIAYCEKAETRVAGPWRAGELIGQGDRSDLAAVAQAIESGQSMLSIARAHPASFMRYGRGFREYDALVKSMRKVDWEMEVIVLWGEPGCGKTYLAKQCFPDAYHFMCQRGSTVWWNGYDDQETIIIDEFANNFAFHYGLRLLNEPGMRVETKGSTIQLFAKRIVITCMQSPIDWWPGVEDNRYALYRRIHFCYKMCGDGTRGTTELWPDGFPVPDKRPGDRWIMDEDYVPPFIRNENMDDTLDIPALEDMEYPTDEELINLPPWFH